MANVVQADRKESRNTARSGRTKLKAPPKVPLRCVTAASLFDGHDAAINIMRRILQAQGVEVIHLGHNRSVDEIVTAAIEEDAHAISVSSYQGGHMEFFTYMIDLLRERGASDIRVFGGGGGVILKEEIKALQAYGVCRIYSPEDGQKMGLKGIVLDLMNKAGHDLPKATARRFERLQTGDQSQLARIITDIERGAMTPALHEKIGKAGERVAPVPVLGITGTGGSGKSSLTDELIYRLRRGFKEPRIGILAIDPTKRRTGGALLGDRIRMNAIEAPNIFMRSLATRGTGHEVPEVMGDLMAAYKNAGFDLIIVETPGIGQGDAGIVPYCDLSLYVMTPEFGAQSQLEKIDMLDFADFVAINKFDHDGAADALRDVSKQLQRNHELFHVPIEEMPVFGTIASRFNDKGVTALFRALVARLATIGFTGWSGDQLLNEVRQDALPTSIIPPIRRTYLSETADLVRAYHNKVDEQARLARERQQLRDCARLLEQSGKHTAALHEEAQLRDVLLDGRSRKMLEDWPDLKRSYAKKERVVKVGKQQETIPLFHHSLSGTPVPKVALPRTNDEGDVLRWLMTENVPGRFPFTAGVFPFKRRGELPTRMFAGEGDAFRTNKRFRYLSKDQPAKRLSTAFDSVTLYGFDPCERPDIYGKIGNSGVSIATLDDMKALYDGFDLCDPSTSVSMTINGPAPAILAMFLNTAIDQQLDRFKADKGRKPTQSEKKKIRQRVLKVVRGTVQADILKEDQGQNTCLFSIEFALKMMGDIQEMFIRNKMRNFYSVSVSGYHIAEAGANPITQLAFTLANGLTYVEAWLARGMKIDDFAPSMSFFFSYGMEPEYTVLGRVARRIWAITMRDRYGANERSQKLKYHAQTSGRSLHAQEVSFNDIRTTLQALAAIHDNANSLHTNAYDEAITTPTSSSVRRALAIQLIINHEWGRAKNENPEQGSFLTEQLTDLVEEAVLAEFDRLSLRGGVLGAMETGYQRGRIQDESLNYETAKHDNSLPIIGVNTFRSNKEIPELSPADLSRSTSQEKHSQIKRLRAFHKRHKIESEPMLMHLKQAVLNGENSFDVLMDAVRCCSLGQITRALFEVGGQYRRNV